MCVTSPVCTFLICAIPPLAPLRRAAQSTTTPLFLLSTFHPTLPSFALLAMSTIDAYLKALLTLSGNEQLATARQNLLQGLTDDDLSELLKKAVGREFARGGLENIISLILDVIARDPASNNGDDTSVSQATASLNMEQV